MQIDMFWQNRVTALVFTGDTEWYWVLAFESHDQTAVLDIHNHICTGCSRHIQRIMLDDIVVKWSAFYQYGLILIQAWISNHMHDNVRGEITHSFRNFNGAAVKVWE